MNECWQILLNLALKLSSRPYFPWPFSSLRTCSCFCDCSSSGSSSSSQLLAVSFLSGSLPWCPFSPLCRNRSPPQPSHHPVCGNDSDLCISSPAFSPVLGPLGQFPPRPSQQIQCVQNGYHSISVVSAIILPGTQTQISRAFLSVVSRAKPRWSCLSCMSHRMIMRTVNKLEEVMGDYPEGFCFFPY